MTANVNRKFHRKIITGNHRKFYMEFQRKFYQNFEGKVFFYRNGKSWKILQKAIPITARASLAFKN